MPISLDYALAMSDGVGPEGGLTDAELDGLAADRFRQAHAGVRARVDGGELGFWKLPTERAVLGEVARVRDALADSVSDVLVLGIGGSSLGTRAMRDALTAPISTAGARLHLPDNSDPWLLSHLLERLEPARTAALVISKSGGTVETAAQLVIVRDWLERAVGREAMAEHMVAITDPNKGGLRALADAQGWPTLPNPANVGGRFSILTGVGLLPAALCGVDCEGLLDGAAAMAERCTSPSLRDNPAGIVAAVHYLHDTLKGRNIHVMMPYSDRLRAFAAWYVQLWAESLGKRFDRAGERVECGPTPLTAVGATDQHAQVQLFMEGPRDKLVTFLAIEDGERDLTVPESQGSTSYLSGTKLSALLDAERVGTTEALASDGRPSLTITVPRLNARALGELFFLYEAATALSGELYGIDAFDQPGVELGKRLAFGLLGRDGYEEAASEIEDRLAKRPTRYRV